MRSLVFPELGRACCRSLPRPWYKSRMIASVDSSRPRFNSRSFGDMERPRSNSIFASLGSFNPISANPFLAYPFTKVFTVPSSLCVCVKRSLASV